MNQSKPNYQSKAMHTNICVTFDLTFATPQSTFKKKKFEHTPFRNNNNVKQNKRDVGPPMIDVDCPRIKFLR